MAVAKQTDESKHVGAHLMVLNGSGQEDFVGPSYTLPCYQA